MATLTATIAQREAEIRQLQAEIARLQGTTGGGVTAPDTRHRRSLEKHPTLPPYPKRTKPISLIVIHHTDTPKTFTPQQIAHYHVFGERKNSEGKVIKEPWPGIGYHFLVGADGAIFQCQREETKSNHVGGGPTTTGWGQPHWSFHEDRPARQTGAARRPVAHRAATAQHGAAGGLVDDQAQRSARKSHGAPRRVGRRHSLPGRSVADWSQVEDGAANPGQRGSGRVTAGASKPLMHYVLFWDHGTDWARDDYRNAQDYIAHFRPTNGFAVDDALHAEHVTIIGGEPGVSAADAARLQAAGCVVHRLAGVDEADTKAKLMALITQNTPWPGAPPMTTAGLIPTSLSVEEAAETAPRTDE
ncbi:MAG: N-acetylmuramoyl-L-alanine amidase [Anaerolineae bacterium]|nr:MAG: N-acetylmuramoyl-L-alanine amidase [Anaerolineae bacterium]